MEIKIKKISVSERRRPRMHYDTLPNMSARPQQRQYNSDMNEYKSTTRVYVWPEGETLLDNLCNRRSRPFKAYKPLVEQQLRDVGYTGKIRWDQKAGCKMCPCSPGFVLETQLDWANPVDVHITVVEV